MSNSPHPEHFSEGAESSNGICQFNADKVRNFMYGMPSLTESAVLCSQNCLGNLPCSQNSLGNRHYLMDAVTDVDPGLSSNQLRRNTLDLFPCNPSQGGAGQSNKNNGGKRSCSGEAQGNAGTVNELKRTKINSDEMDSDVPQRRELLLYKEEDVSNSGLGMPFDGKEDETNIDLSLHLYL